MPDAALLEKCFGFQAIQKTSKHLMAHYFSFLFHLPMDTNKWPLMVKKKTPLDFPSTVREHVEVGGGMAGWQVPVKAQVAIKPQL